MKNQIGNYDVVNGWNINPGDVTSALYEMYVNSLCDGENEFDETIKSERLRQEIEDGVYYLNSICDNPYNKDYFRTFYQVLANITETHNNNSDDINWIAKRLLPYFPLYDEDDLKDALLYDPTSMFDSLIGLLEEKGVKI